MRSLRSLRSLRSFAFAGVAAAACAASVSAGTFSSSDFPPAGASFHIPFISFFGGGATIDDLFVSDFSSSFALNDDGNPHNYAFTGTARTNGLDFLASMTFSITNTSIVGSERSYAIEMTQFDIDASPFFGGPLFVRESPTETSGGTLTINELPGGLFQINSFFDVFVELSIDGTEWFAGDGPGRASLVVIPMPMAAASGLAMLGIMAVRRRRTIG